ncbi:uncharacterized protein GJ701_006632 isoform 1-T1 [Geothlypis trichas]
MLSAMLGMSSELGFGPGPPATPGRVHQAMGLIQSDSFDVSNKGQHLYKEHTDKWMSQASGLEKTSASNILMDCEDLGLERGVLVDAHIVVFPSCNQDIVSSPKFTNSKDQQEAEASQRRQHPLPGTAMGLPFLVLFSRTALAPSSTFIV